MNSTPLWKLGLPAVAVILAAGCGDDEDRDTIVDPGSGSEYTVEVSPGNDLSATLTISFTDSTVTIDEGSFDISAELLEPGDFAKTSRLPAGVFIPDDFPVLVRINPSSAALSFTGSWALELVSENLEYSSHTPLRLFKAPDGGAFSDISTSIGSGSFRVRGLGGSFSEFLIAADLRPQRTIVMTKLARMESLVLGAENGLDESAITELQEKIDGIRSALENEEMGEAATVTDELISAIISRSGSGIPDVFNAGAGNIAGDLVGIARSVSLSFDIPDDPVPEGTAVVERDFTLGGEISLRARVIFEGVQRVDLEGFDISAELVDPRVELVDRLPSSVTVPAEFPVLIHVDAGANVNQAFRGTVLFEIITDNLAFSEAIPLRLFKAPDGGAFSDVTETYGLGSLRVRAAGGRFSEFVVAADLRPINAVAAGKFVRLLAILTENENSVSSELFAELSGRLQTAHLAFESGNMFAATATLNQFRSIVSKASGRGVPDIWHVSGDRVNVAGELDGLARTLLYSLELVSD